MRTLAVIIFSFSVGAGWFLIHEAVKPGYTYNFWINIDELANVILYGENETISARVGRASKEGNGLATAFCYILDLAFDEKGHCEKALGEN